jgi:hypothetical protein
LVLLGAPKPMAGLIILAYLAYRANNRPVSNVSPADRDQLLAQGPPYNHGLVYVHRGIGVGGLVVGFNVKLDHADVALLKVARFTRRLACCEGLDRCDHASRPEASGCGPNRYV